MLPNVHFGMPARMLLAGLLAGSIALFAVMTIGGPAPAGAAAGNCPGSLIESRNLNVGGKKVGELDVYYDSSTGRNCARMNHAGSTWGKKLKTRAWIGICSERTPGNKTCHYDPATDDVDVGSYSYYAGPVTTKTSAAGRCIAASGYLWINGTRYAVGTDPWVGRCG
jgi:hypothetical protein